MQKASIHARWNDEFLTFTLRQVYSPNDLLKLSDLIVVRHLLPSRAKLSTFVHQPIFSPHFMKENK